MPPSHPHQVTPDYFVNVLWHVLVRALNRLGFAMILDSGLKVTFRRQQPPATIIVHVQPRLEGWVGQDAVQRLAEDLGIRPIDLLIAAGLEQNLLIKEIEAAEQRELRRVPDGVPTLE